MNTQEQERLRKENEQMRALLSELYQRLITRQVEGPTELLRVRMEPFISPPVKR